MRSGEHRAGHDRRQVRADLGPVAGDPVREIQADRSGPGVAPGQALHEPVKVLLLVIDDIVAISGHIGIGDISRGAHRAERSHQRIVFVLRLIEQDIDPDRLRPQSIEIVQRLGQQPPIKRRALAGSDQGLVVINDKEDARVLLDAGRGKIRPQIIQRPFGITDAGYGPGKAGKRYRNQQ